MKTKHTLLYTLFCIMAFAIAVPNASAHWTSKGPFGGKVLCFLPSDTLLYVGSFDGGVYRSTSSAVNAWRYANYTGLAEGQINAMEQMGTSIFAGTPAGIFKSVDIGTTWTAANTGLTNTDVLSVVKAGTRLLAGTNGGGIFKSDDGGTTWTVSNTGLTNLTVSCFAYNGSRIFAGTMGGGVFMSTDNGNTWSAVNTGLSTMNIECLATSGGNIFAGTISGMFFSSASSVSWTPGNTGLGSTTIFSMTASGGKIYAGTNVGVFTSLDAAPLWADASTGYTGPVTAISVFGGKVYMGTDEDGIFKSNSTSSISWIKHNNGFNNLEAYTVYNDEFLVIVATSKGVFVSRDLAASYTSANNGLTDSTGVTSFAFSGSDLYASTMGGGVFLSTDTGGTWTPVNTGLTNLNIVKIVFRGFDVLAASDNGEVFISSIPTISWSLTTGLPAGLDITSMASNGFGLALLGTSGDGIFMLQSAPSWVDVNTGLTNTDVTCLHIKDDVAYAGTWGGGVFRWIDPGMSSPSWSAVNTNLPDLEISAVYGVDDWMLVGYKGGVHASENNGSTWYPTNVMEYIPNYAYVHAISYSTLSSRIFVATPNNSVYSNNISELPTGMSVGEVVDANDVFSIAPNPGNGHFTVTLKDDQTPITGITVMDLSGKTVSTVEALKKTSSMQVSLNLAKGIYLVKVITETGNATQKLVVE